MVAVVMGIERLIVLIEANGPPAQRDSPHRIGVFALLRDNGREGSKQQEHEYQWERKPHHVPFPNNPMSGRLRPESLEIGETSTGCV